MRRPRLAPVLAALAALAAACAPAATPASASPTSSPASPTAAPSRSPTAAPSISPAPTAALRTPAPVPTAVPADLVVRVDAHSDTCCGVTSIVVAADGTYLVSSADFTRDYAVRQLTADGVRLVRERILATGLFGADASFGLVPRPGAVPPGHGASGLGFSFWTGTRTIHLTFTRVLAGEEQFYEPSPGRDALAALADVLRAPTTWLPASAWRDATPRPFVAASYRVISGPGPMFGPFGPPDPPFDLAKPTWPFVTPLGSFGDTIVPPGESRPVGPQVWRLDGPVRCARVTPGDALALRDAFVDARARIWTFPNGGFGVQGMLAGTPTLLLVLPTLPTAPPCAEDLL